MACPLQNTLRFLQGPGYLHYMVVCGYPSRIVMLRKILSRIASIAIEQ